MKPSIGLMISEFCQSSMAFISTAAGCDFMIVDTEHGPFSVEDSAGICAASMANGMSVIIRVPNGERAGITKALDMGATGVLVPMVSTPEEARQIVEYSKYSPVGKRGLSTTRLHSRYDPGPLPQYMAAANERVQVWVQIETRAGLAAVNDIAATPGLSGVLLGPNDLLQDLGEPGDLDSPTLLAAIEKVGEAAQGAGIRAGIASSSSAVIERASAQGYDFLSIGSDVGMLISACRTKVDAARRVGIGG